MDCSMPGFPVLHHLPELAQTHVHRIGDAIQPSHPLSSPPPPAFNLSQHQGLANELFASGSQSNRTSASASVLPTNIQGWFPLELTGLIALLNLSPSLTAHQPFEPSVYAWSTSAHSDLRACSFLYLELSSLGLQSSLEGTSLTRRHQVSPPPLMLLSQSLSSPHPPQYKINFLYMSIFSFPH